MGVDAAEFLDAFIETEILIFTKGRSLPTVRKLQLSRREEDLEEEEQDSPPFTTLTESLRLTKREKPSEELEQTQ